MDTSRWPVQSWPHAGLRSFKRTCIFIRYQLVDEIERKRGITQFAQGYKVTQLQVPDYDFSTEIKQNRALRGTDTRLSQKRVMNVGRIMISFLTLNIAEIFSQLQ